MWWGGMVSCGETSEICICKVKSASESAPKKGQIKTADLRVYDAQMQIESDVQIGI